MVVQFPRAAGNTARAEDWPRDPETRSLDAARLGNKLQRLALERPSAMAIIEMIADKLLAEIEPFTEK
ncbi:MAG TPA: hypothetical protein VEA16_09265 [Vicinamibacterales bacterium]|nr:hypothetical protein [Vicinamibacterales bacterium]